MIKKFDDYIKEDSITTGSFGSGTAVGTTGNIGNFISANGTSVSGGDSGTAFSTNSNSNGMGNVVSAQPSSIPGAVWAKDAKDGSGDIGSKGGAYTKQPAYNQEKKGKKKNKKMDKAADKLNNLYIVKFTEFDGIKNVKENVYTPPTMTKCKECGMEVEDTLKDMVGHVYLKHWAKPNNMMKDEEAREMVLRFFHEIKEK